jgi:hypothetical protein
MSQTEPNAASVRRPERPATGRIRLISVAAVVVLAGGAAAAYQIGRPKHPSFRRGGAFAATQRSGLAPTTAAGTAVPDVADTATLPSASAAAASTAASAPRPAAAPTSTTTLAPGGAPPAAATPLALGTYTYAVTGNESVTGFGSRSYPPALTAVAHGDPSLPPDEVAWDLAFSPQHSERDVLAYAPGGVAFAFEAGAITFGPATQTSQADYVPPMVQVPLPLRVGDVRSGTTQARGQNGSVSRVEDWTVKVTGQETLVIDGSKVPTWVVTLERHTRPGSTDQATRSRTYWYDPARRIWVKWRERMHGQRKTLGFTFTYDTSYEATLTGFTAT